MCVQLLWTGKAPPKELPCKQSFSQDTQPLIGKAKRKLSASSKNPQAQPALETTEFKGCCSMSPGPGLSITLPFISSLDSSSLEFLRN